MRKKPDAVRLQQHLPPSRGNDWLTNALFLGTGAALGSLGLMMAGRKVASLVVRRATKTFMTDEYSENLLEFYSAGMRTGLLNIGETNLRVNAGKAIERPLGSPKKRGPDFSGLMFDMAQLDTLPTQMTVPISLKSVLGPKAAKPLHLDIPIIISGMAYGWALSERAKIALALGASGAGTATNTGQGPWLESERRAADKLIFQYDRTNCFKDPDLYKQVDAIEIQLGQGASAGCGMVLLPRYIDEHLRQQFAVGPQEAVISNARQPGIHRASDLVNLVHELRTLSGGVPIGVKLGAGQQLEKDLHFAVQADVDFITLDGAMAATKGSAPILQDDFGLPTLFAVVRASKWLEEKKLKGQISLVVSGGLQSPGEYLKAIALGADLVAIGTMALYAITHTQVTNAIPFEPPTQVVWYDGKAADRFNPITGGQSLAMYLASCADEIKHAIQALGLTNLAEVDKRYLFALDNATAETCDLPVGYRPTP